MDKLEELNLTTNTMIVFTSDNGRVMDDGYDDYAEGITSDDYGAHDAEAGTRVPFIVRWPGTVPSNTVSDALVVQTDMLASFAALAGQPLPTDAGPDSENILPALLGQSATGRERFCPDLQRPARWQLEIPQRFALRPLLRHCRNLRHRHLKL